MDWGDCDCLPESSAVFEMSVQACLTFHKFERLSKGRCLSFLKCYSSTERHRTLQPDNKPIVLVPLHVRERQDNRECRISEISCRLCLSKSCFFFSGRLVLNNRSVTSRFISTFFLSLLCINVQCSLAFSCQIQIRALGRHSTALASVHIVSVLF